MFKNIFNIPKSDSFKDNVVNDLSSTDYSAMDPYSDYTPNQSQSQTGSKKSPTGSEGENPPNENGQNGQIGKGRRDGYRRSMTHPRVQGGNKKQNERRRKRQASDDFINELEKV